MERIIMYALAVITIAVIWYLSQWLMRRVMLKKKWMQNAKIDKNEKGKK